MLPRDRPPAVEHRPGALAHPDQVDGCEPGPGQTGALDLQAVMALVDDLGEAPEEGQEARLVLDPLEHREGKDHVRPEGGELPLPVGIAIEVDLLELGPDAMGEGHLAGGAQDHRVAIDPKRCRSRLLLEQAGRQQAQVAAQLQDSAARGSW